MYSTLALEVFLGWRPRLLLTRLCNRARQWLGETLAHSVARWMVPLRTLRQVGGWHPPTIQLEETRSILVVRPDEIGDLVLTGPFLRELRRVAPAAHITLIVKKHCQELVELCPYVDAVYSLDFPPNGNKRRVFLLFAAWRLRWSRFSWQGFQLVLLPRSSPDWYDAELVATVLAGTGKIVVNRECLGHRSGRSFVKNTETADFSEAQILHEVPRNLKLLQRYGAVITPNPPLELWITESDREFSRKVLSSGGQYVAFCGGARDSARRWPIDRFSAVAAQLRDQHGVVPVILGARGDPEFSGAVNLIGRTTLRQAAAVLERCALYVGNDTGSKHIAAAMGIPTVEISAFRCGGDINHVSSPARFRAWGVPYRLAQPPAGPSIFAIEEIAIDHVLRLCTALLSAPIEHQIR